jgi:DNA-directed RNA polymerase specialized sigma24 family protein
MRGRWSEEELERTRRAALTLRPIELEVLLLSAQDRLRNEEIAARLGISTRAVRRHLARPVYRLAQAADDLPRPWWRFW